jgi:hypothetical protein
MGESTDEMGVLSAPKILLPVSPSLGALPKLADLVRTHVHRGHLWRHDDGAGRASAVTVAHPRRQSEVDANAFVGY